MSIHPDLTPFAPLPHAVLQRTDLTPVAKLVFAALADLPPQRDGLVRVSIGRLASAVGCSRSAVHRAIGILGLRSLADVHHLAGRRLSIRILPGCGPPQGCQKDTTQPVPKRARGGVKMSAGGCQKDTPARVTALSTALNHNNQPPRRDGPPRRSREVLRVPAGIEPLIWSAAIQRLKALHAEAFGVAGAMPARWHDRLADEMRGGNTRIAETLSAADLTEARRRAASLKRPFGFGWVANVWQERMLAESSSRSKPAQTVRQTATAYRETALAPDDAEMAEQARLAERRLIRFAQIDHSEQDRWIEQACRQNPFLKLESTLRSQAAWMWEQATHDGGIDGFDDA